jgi:hypothetical protein
MGIFHSNLYLLDDVIYQSYITNLNTEGVSFLIDGTTEMSLKFVDDIKEQCYQILNKINDDNYALIDYYEGILYGIRDSNNRYEAYISNEVSPTTFGWVLIKNE